MYLACLEEETCGWVEHIDTIDIPDEADCPVCQSPVVCWTDIFWLDHIKAPPAPDGPDGETG